MTQEQIAQSAELIAISYRFDVNNYGGCGSIPSDLDTDFVAKLLGKAGTSEEYEELANGEFDLDTYIVLLDRVSHIWEEWDYFSLPYIPYEKLTIADDKPAIRVLSRDQIVLNSGKEFDSLQDYTAYSEELTAEMNKVCGGVE